MTCPNYCGTANMGKLCVVGQLNDVPIAVSQTASSDNSTRAGQ